MQEIISKIRNKNKIFRLFVMIFSLLLNAAIYNVFLLKLHIVSGGTSGIATITNYLYDIDPSFMILLLSIACGIIGFLYLDLDVAVSSIIASIIYPIFVKITFPLSETILFSQRDMMIVIIFAGALSGVANGLMYKSGYPMGGFPVLFKIINKNFNISISKCSLIANIIVIILGGFCFGMENAMYAIILLYINNLVLDKVLLGISSNKAFYIITSKEEEIKDYIINYLHHNVTIFDVKGGFLDKKRNVLLSVIPTNEYYKFTECIKEIDSDAFFVATDSYEVIGGR